MSTIQGAWERDEWGKFIFFNSCKIVFNCGFNLLWEVK